jgi:putative salt-induced outer membrane protein
MRCLLLLTPLLIAATEPPAIPAPVRAMLDAAIAGGNDAEVATIVKFARAADPASGEAAAAIADGWRAEQAAARKEKLATAGPLELWSGRAELGGFATTGNSDTVGVTGAIDLQREGLNWRHKLNLRVDYQESLGVTSRERLLLAYEPNLKLDGRRYVYGAAQFESDRFLGYDERYSLSAGAGYGLVRTPRVTVDVEVGPAFRATDFTDGKQEASVAARGKVDLAWQLSRGLKLSQNASAYVQQFNSTVSSNTALSARLLGPLSAQLSYAVQYESMPPAGRRTTDTTSRAALVYSF